MSAQSTFRLTRPERHHPVPVPGEPHWEHQSQDSPTWDDGYMRSEPKKRLILTRNPSPVSENLHRTVHQLGRPRHARLVRGASQPHLQRGPRGGLVQPEEAACTHAARVSTPVSARGRGERVRGTARQRAVACGALAHARPSANPNQGVQAWRVGRASGRTWQCLPRSAHQEERQRTCDPRWPPWPPLNRNLEKKR